MFTKRLALVFVSILLSNISMAADSPWVKVSVIKTWGNSDLIMSTIDYETESFIDTTCNTHKIQIDVTNAEGRARMFSMLLAAKASGSKVRFWYESGQCGSTGNAQKTSVLSVSE